MNLFNDFYPNTYHEAITYYPVFYRDVLELRAILDGLGRINDTLKDAFNLVLSNNFIKTADEATIKALEHFYKLPYNPERSLKERRSMVLASSIGSDHIGTMEIKQMVAAYTDGLCNVYFQNSTVTVEVSAIGLSSLAASDLVSVLERRIPAHLGVQIRYILNAEPVFNLYTAVAVGVYKRIEVEVIKQ